MTSPTSLCLTLSEDVQRVFRGIRLYNSHSSAPKPSSHTLTAFQRTVQQANAQLTTVHTLNCGRFTHSLAVIQKGARNHSIPHMVGHRVGCIQDCTDAPLGITSATLLRRCLHTQRGRDLPASTWGAGERGSQCHPGSQPTGRATQLWETGYCTTNCTAENRSGGRTCRRDEGWRSRKTP